MPHNDTDILPITYRMALMKNIEGIEFQGNYNEHLNFNEKYKPYFLIMITL